MTFLTRMELNGQRRKTGFFLHNARAMRGAVLAAFPESQRAGEADSRILWRVDREPHSIKLYIVSPMMPSLEHLQEQAGWSQQETWKSAEYESFLTGIERGQNYRFRLRANPTKALVNKQGKKVRAGLRAEGEQLQWLLARQELLGVRFPVVAVGEEKNPTVRITQRDRLDFARDKHKVSLESVQFDGMIEVDNPDSLRKILTTGVGHGRAYGQGLLTLAPV